MGCLGLIGDVLGFSVIRRAWRSSRGWTLLALAAVWGWAFVEGTLIVRYAHLGEHPYVFLILPLVSCVSPFTAAVGVLAFTAGDALTNLFSTALTSSFGISPVVDLYAMLGRASPLLTWGAYVRLGLVGLMAYAVLPGLMARTAFHVAVGAVRRLRRPVHADGPASAAGEAASAGFSTREMIAGYEGAVAGAAAGTAMGGGLFYGHMWAEYFPLRRLFHPSGQPDPSCFQMDADYAVDAVATGGRMSPAGAAAVVVSGGAGPNTAPIGPTSTTQRAGKPPPGTAEPGRPPPMGSGATNLESGDKVVSILNELRTLALDRRLQRVEADRIDSLRKKRARKMDADEFEMRRERRAQEADDVVQARAELSMLADVVNMLYDWQNYMKNDGMNALEAGVTSIGGNLLGNAVGNALGSTDFAAGIFFPQSMQGYVPSNAAKDGVKASVNGVKAWGSHLGGDEQALDRYGQSAMDGDQGKIAEGWANIFDSCGTLYEDPMGTLNEINNGINEIWEAGPMELIEEAAERFAQDALEGKEGPMAQTVAEMANGAGHFVEDPKGTLEELNSDLEQIKEQGQLGDLLIGQEGSDRAVQILGPIGEGYKEMSNLIGEAAGNPRQMAKDIIDVTGHAVRETGKSLGRAAASAWGGLRTGFGLWG